MINGHHITLGIESSCDETAVGIVQDGRKILANIISSQIDIHTKFGERNDYSFIGDIDPDRRT